MVRSPDAQGVNADIPDTQPDDRLEIRLFATLKVRRPDGTLVAANEWRTGKTADLLRLLALAAGDVVPAADLLDTLWPTTDESRARASLRTAACHLRKVLGADRVQRDSTGLRLAAAWVDATAFTTLVDEVRRHRRQGRVAECVRAAREADALYVGDFRAHDDDSVWACEWRERLRLEHLGMLTDAAEAAVELGWVRDAVDFARRVLERDPCSERAYRVEMQGYAGLGETERALRAFDRCRRVLAEELGADPSPQTRALHLHVLRAEPVVADVAPWCGREAQVQWLAGALDTVAATRRPALIRLRGAEGSGRRRMVQEAAQRSGLPVPLTGDDVPLTELTAQTGGCDPLVVVLTEPEYDDAVAGHDGAVAALLWAPAPVAVVVVGRPRPGADDRPRLPDGIVADTLSLDLQPLTAAEIEALAAKVLGGTVAPQLAAELTEAAQGNLGRALAALDHWTRSCRITSTSGGLVLAATEAGETPPDVERLLATLMPKLGSD
jgi:DNA-binding SARP family transcriptional activator